MAKRNNKARRKKNKMKKKEAREAAVESIPAQQCSSTPPSTTQEEARQEQANLAEMVEALRPLPLQYFEQVLRSVICPNESVDDLMRVRQRDSFKEIVRSMYLQKKYTMSPNYRHGVAALNRKDILPTRADVIRIFNLKRANPSEWKRAKPLQHLEREEAILANVENGCTKNLSFEEVLEASGCRVIGRGPFNLFCEDSGRYELWTREYISCLASYLDERLSTLDVERRRGQVVELGAGSGALSYFLNQQSGFNHEIVATDADLRPAPRQRIRMKDGPYPVEQLGFIQAVRKYKPSIVLIAWMPMDQDWTRALRAIPEVQEIILIGEADFGACGHNYHTWSNSDFENHPLQRHDESEAFELEKKSVDHFTRCDLFDISKYQMQRYDSDEYDGNSITVSFRRNKNIC